MQIKPILPARLRRGDTLGLFCPAGPVKNIKNFEIGVKILTDTGFKIKTTGNYLSKNNEYLAATDSERAKNLLSLWEDDEVKAIMAIRGGFGSIRLMPFLDFSIIKQNPKLLIGFSDVTALLSALMKQANIISCHGPVVTSLCKNNQESLASFFSFITGAQQETFKPNDLEILRAAETTSGTLAGGNLTTLMHLIETPWDFSCENTVLFLEDTNELPYKLDRMLTHLAYTGRLSKLKGLILGSFDNGWEDRLQAIRMQEQLWTRVLELCSQSTYPIWGNFPVGHLEKNITLPIGMTVSMDSSAGSLKMHLESAQAL